MKSFLKYFKSKMILLNTFQDVAIDLFQYLVSHNMIIPRNGTFLYYRPNQNFLVLHHFTKCFSGTGVNQIVNKFLNGYLSRLLNLLSSAP